MSKSVESITKTSRLLVVFHLFRHCQEVSFKEITDMLPVSEKTVYRDIQILKRAGVLQIRYSKRQEAFVPASLNFTEPDWPENQTQRRYLEKIRRLCTLMVQIEGAEDPIAWYPGLSDRTRQRDFKELDKIGYQIGYNPLRNPDRDWDPHYEPGWYYEFPSGAYDITF